MISDIFYLCPVCVFQSYGAEANRPMGIPGENLSGIFSAKDIVGWYNGIPANKEVVLFVNGLDQSVGMCV